MKPDKASPRQLRHLDLISQYTTDIRHVAGLENVVADALSRISAIIITGPIDFKKLAKEQISDPELKLILKNPSLKVKLLSLTDSDVKLYSVHNLAHPGIRATNVLLRKQYIWPGMNKDVRF